MTTPGETWGVTPESLPGDEGEPHVMDLKTHLGLGGGQEAVLCRAEPLLWGSLLQDLHGFTWHSIMPREATHQAVCVQRVRLWPQKVSHWPLTEKMELPPAPRRGRTTPSLPRRQSPFLGGGPGAAGQPMLCRQRPDHVRCFTGTCCRSERHSGTGAPAILVGHRGFSNRAQWGLGGTIPGDSDSGSNAGHCIFRNYVQTCWKTDSESKCVCFLGFFGHTHSVGNFTGQGSNLHHSCDPNHSSGHAARPPGNNESRCVCVLPLGVQGWDRAGKLDHER